MSIVLAAVLALGVVVTIVVSVQDRTTRTLVPLHGAITPELKSFFDDARVKAVFDHHGYKLDVDTAPTGTIVRTFDLSKYDFAFVAGTPAAQQIRADHGSIGRTYAPFSTPLAFATFTDIAQLLEGAGVARPRDGYWTLDVARYLDLVGRHTRWNALRDNRTYASTRPVLARTADATSDVAAAYASVVSYVLNGNRVLAGPGQVDAVVNSVIPLFLEQRDASSPNASPVDEYFVSGEARAPLVAMYESQFVDRATTPGEIRPNMVLMYPQPEVSTQHTLVALEPNADPVGRLLSDDPTLQRLEVEHGFRPAADANAFIRFVTQHHVTVEADVPDLIEPPSSDTLESLITKVDAAVHAPLVPHSVTVSPNSGSGSP